MNVFKFININLLISTFIVSFLLVLIAGSIYISFLFGYQKGQVDLSNDYQVLVDQYISEKASSKVEYPLSIVPAISPIPEAVRQKPTSITWLGPELWEAVNIKRVEYGVNPLKQKDELCTIASIRLNELLEFGKLDGHEGFSNLSERRPDLKPIFDTYVIAEFLSSGAVSVSEAVSLWENTLGHKKILTGGEYVWGCIYAQNGFAVGISAYR